jgi:RNA polymerase sigma-70 factor (ECF subfamily)
MSGSAPNLHETTAADGWFKTTHWSTVLEAGHKDPAQAAAALNRLCRTYWYPLYTYVRRLGHGHDDAKDLTQEFFARLLERDSFSSVQPGRAKFRSFLLVALKRFLANEWRRANRQKRGGGQELISLDTEDTENRYLCEPVDAMTPEKAFERRWALTLLDQVLARLETEFSLEGKATLFKELSPFLSGDQAPGAYPEISQRLGLSEGALRVSVHRLRQRYRELLRLEIANTVGAPEEIDEEIRHLFASLA